MPNNKWPMSHIIALIEVAGVYLRADQGRDDAKKGPGVPKRNGAMAAQLNEAIKDDIAPATYSEKDVSYKLKWLQEKLREAQKTIREAKSVQKLTGSDTATVLEKLPKLKQNLTGNIPWLEQYLLSFAGDPSLDLEAPVIVGHTQSQPAVIVDAPIMGKRTRLPSLAKRENQETEITVAELEGAKKAAKRALAAAAGLPAKTTTAATDSVVPAACDAGENNVLTEDGTCTIDITAVESTSPAKSTQQPAPKRIKKSPRKNHSARIPRGASKDMAAAARVANERNQEHQEGLKVVAVAFQNSAALRATTVAAKMDMDMARNLRNDVAKLRTEMREYRLMKIQHKNDMDAEEKEEIDSILQDLHQKETELMTQALEIERNALEMRDKALSKVDAELQSQPQRPVREQVTEAQQQQQQQQEEENDAAAGGERARSREITIETPAWTARSVPATAAVDDAEDTIAG